MTQLDSLSRAFAASNAPSGPAVDFGGLMASAQPLPDAAPAAVTASAGSASAGSLVAFQPPAAATEALREALEAAYRAPSFTPPPAGGFGANIVRGLSLLLAFVAGRYLTSEGELNLLKDTGQVPGYVTMNTMQDASTALDRAGSAAPYSMENLSVGQRGQFLLGAAALGRKAGDLSPGQMRQALGDLYRAVASGQLPAPAKPQAPAVRPPAAQPPAATPPAAAPPAPRPPVSLGRPEPVAVPPVPIAPPVAAPPPPRIDTATLTLGDQRFTLVTDGAGWAVDLPDGRRFGIPGAGSRPDAAERVKDVWLNGDVPGFKPPESGLQMGGRQFQIRGANGTYGLEDPDGAYLGRIHAPGLAQAAEIAKGAFLDGTLPGNKPLENGLEMGGRQFQIRGGGKGPFGLEAPDGSYIGEIKGVSSLADAAEVAKGAWLRGQVPGFPPPSSRLTLDEGSDQRATVLGGGKGPFALGDRDGRFIAPIDASSLAEASGVAKDAFATGGLEAFGFKPPRAAGPQGPSASSPVPQPAPGVGAPLAPAEQGEWDDYARRFPSITTIVREAGHGADDGSLNEAKRALMRGAYGADVVAWLRNGGIMGGPPPGGRPPGSPRPASEPDPEEGRAIGRYVNDRWREDLDALTPVLRNALADYLQRTLDNLPPDFEFWRGDLEKAVSALRGAGGVQAPGAAGPVPDNVTVSLGQEDWNGSVPLRVVETLRAGVTGGIPFPGVESPQAPVPRPADASQAPFEPVESASRRFLVPHEGYGQDPIFSQHASVEATKAARGIQDGSVTSLGQLWETLTRERYEFQKARGDTDPAFGFNRATGAQVDENQRLKRDWLTPTNQLATILGGDARYQDYVPKAAEKAGELAARIPGAPAVPAGDEPVVKKFFVDPSGDPAMMQEIEVYGSGDQGLARHPTHRDSAVLFESAGQMYDLAMSGALDRQGTVEALARMYYRLANGMPNLRGSAAVAHETLVAAGRAVGIEFPPMAPGKVLDLEAITAPTEDEFVRGFAAYLNGPIAFRGGPGR